MERLAPFSWNCQDQRNLLLIVQKNQPQTMARWFESVEGSNSSSLEALIADHAKKQQDQFAYLYSNPLSEKDDLDEVINSPPYYEKLPCLQNGSKTENSKHFLII
jgi:hypothetical protein